MSFFALALLAGLFFTNAAVTAEKIHNFHMCRHAKCQITEVFIDPCAEAVDDEPCEIPQGQNATIKFKYIPKFGSRIPKTRLYAVMLLDLPFMDMDTNACLYTNCPIVANEIQSWKYNLFISENYPRAGYTVKLKFWDADKDADIISECCFTFDIKIV